MTPFTILATARTPDGATLTLHERPPHFYLRVNGQPLMATNASISEIVLAEVSCAKLASVKSPRVLIGGLGFGYSLRRVLELVGAGATVEVAELLWEVVAWNQQFLGAINGELLSDPRVRVKVQDVFQTISQAPPGSYDAILLDVDNGPIAMVQDGNSRLYQTQGFAAITRALKPRGRVAFWSASPDPAFAKRLAQAGFQVSTTAAKAHAHARRSDHIIYVADRHG
jgi:spermidine synthase